MKIHNQICKVNATTAARSHSPRKKELAVWLENIHVTEVLLYDIWPWATVNSITEMVQDRHVPFLFSSRLFLLLIKSYCLIKKHFRSTWPSIDTSLQCVATNGCTNTAQGRWGGFGIRARGFFRRLHRWESVLWNSFQNGTSYLHGNSILLMRWKSKFLLLVLLQSYKLYPRAVSTFQGPRFPSTWYK